MSGRYTKLFALPEGRELYGEGSPVLIVAGALSKDNQTKNTLVQLKFRSIERRTIRELTVRVQPMDADGASMGEVEHRYQELSAELEEEFGAKSPIFLNSAGVRSFSARVTGAVFTDGSTWQDENADWGLLPEKSEIKDVGWEPELCKQFRMEYKMEGGYLPWHARGLWLCPRCGKLNRETAEECYVCQTRKPGPDYLEILCQHMNVRLEEERKAAAEAERKREEAERKRKEASKKAKKVGMIAAAAVALVVVVVVVYQAFIKDMLAYQKAERLARQGEYEAAIAAFEALGDYGDSAEQILATRYAQAANWEESGEYEKAIQEFISLNDYEDSAERALGARYAQAVAYENDGKYGDAARTFATVGNYKDSAERATADQYAQAIAFADDGRYGAAAELLSRLGDYEDSRALLPEFTVQFIINGFAYRDLYLDGQSAETYLSKQMETYPVVPAAEIASVIAGDWYICRGSSVFHPATLDANGTGSWKADGVGTTVTSEWTVENDVFYYQDDVSIGELNSYTVRTVAEGVYAFYNGDGEPCCLLVSQNSDYGSRLVDAKK